MKTFVLLKERIDRLILLAPCISHRAVLLSPLQKMAVRQISRLLKSRAIRSALAQSMRKRDNRRWMARLLHWIGKVENLAQLEDKLAKIGPALMETVAREVDEILSIEWPRAQSQYRAPCYFAMSVNDPLLDFDATLHELRCRFETVHVAELDYPFHQRSQPFTFEELNQHFGVAVEAFLSGQ